MALVMIALAMAFAVMVAKDRARRFPAPQEYRDEEWCSSPFSRTKYTDGEPRGVQND